MHLTIYFFIVYCIGILILYTSGLPVSVAAGVYDLVVYLG